MHILTETLRHQSFASSFLIDGELQVGKLKVTAQVHIHAMAWRQTRGVGNALRILKQHPEFEPTDDELAELSTTTSTGPTVTIDMAPPCLHGSSLSKA